MQTQGRSAGSASALLALMPFLLGAVAAPIVGIGGSKTAMPMAIVITFCSFAAFLCYWTLVRKVEHS